MAIEDDTTGVREIEAPGSTAFVEGDTLGASDDLGGLSPGPDTQDGEGGDPGPDRRMAAPEDLGEDPRGKQLLRRKLFPRRSQPVKIGRYTVLKLLGQGGMGVVYACFDDLLDRKIAVKVLHLGRVRDHELSRVRLLREAQAMARISHPNIITAFEVGQTGEEVYVAMEFIRGVTLDAWVLQPRSWREVVAAFVQAGRGLEAAHRAGLIHRDFKPQNVMMSEEGQVKVLDFGLARAHESEGDSSPRLRDPSGSPGEEGEATGALLLRPLTRTGLMLGTPAYMPPEQHSGEPATAASDQFSFCVSLYQCLYGVLPFASDSLAALLNDVLTGNVAAPPPRSPVPAWVFKALRRGMMVKPAERFGSMTELLSALQRDPAVIYRRVGVLTVTAAVAGAVSIMIAGGSALVQCPDAHAELAGVWDAERAAEVRSGVQATGSPRAEEVLGLALPQAQRYADAWVQMRNDACLAHAEGRQSAQLFDLRTSCLDQRRASLDAAVDTLTAAEAANIDGLIQAVGRLPPLDTCADTEALTAAIAPPEEPALRARVQEHREALARAEVYEHTGQQGRGLELVEAVLADAEAAAYEPLLAEAQLRKGSLEMQGGDSEAADRSFNAALWTALGVGHAAVAAQTSSRRGFLRTVRLGRQADALVDLPLIAALNRRVEGDVELYSEYLNYAGTIHASAAGDWAHALQMSEAAVALRERHGRLATPQGIGMLYNVGVIHREEGRYEQAQPILRRAIALSDEILGRRQAERTLFEVVLALNLQSLGRPREALAVLAPILADLEGIASTEYRKLALAVAGMIELADDDARAAHRHLGAARQGPGHFPFLYWIELMRAAAADGDAPGMQAAHDAALALVAKPLDLNDFNYQDFLLAYGRALGSLGRAREAVEALAPVKGALAGASTARDRRRGAAVALELGRQYIELGDSEAAERELMAALAGFERVLTPRNLELADVRLALGEQALQRGRFEQARTWLSGAEQIYMSTAEPDYTPRARARFMYAQALTGAGADASDQVKLVVKAEAKLAAETALAALRARSRTDEAGAVEAWLAEHP